MLLLFGSNHLSTPVAMREKMAIGPDRLAEALDRLLAFDEISEAMILSTCNRVELLVRSTDGLQGGTGAVQEFIHRRQSVTREQFERYGYRFVEGEAVQHLFRVACGLDSMILGEAQIQGQVKQAYLAAKAHRATGPLLDRLLQHCLATAKRVRTETGISRHPVSVAFAAAQLARRIFGDLHGRRALLLGAGKMGGLVARYLKRGGVESLTVSSRTYRNAVLAAEKTGGRAVYWEEGLARLGEVDIVVSCTAAPERILDRSAIEAAVRGRRGVPLFLIDIAVPRDIDPEVDELEHVYLYDIDALQGVIDSNLDERRRAAEQAQKLIVKEVSRFQHWRDSQDLVPVIVALREKMMAIGRAEIDRHRSKLEAPGGDPALAAEELTRAVIQKILHRPIRVIRDSIENDESSESAELVRRIFGLDEPGRAERGKGKGDDGAERRGPRRLLKGGKHD